MKLKIVNLGKFIRSILIILGIIICVSLFINNTSFSHVDTKVKTIYVANGDTLWNIAKEQKENNLYYQNKDVREIINDIKSINKLSNSEVLENQKLVIPSL